jgi:hypothetical protein
MHAPSRVRHTVHVSLKRSAAMLWIPPTGSIATLSAMYVSGSHVAQNRCALVVAVQVAFVKSKGLRNQEITSYMLEGWVTRLHICSRVGFQALWVHNWIRLVQPPPLPARRGLERAPLHRAVAVQVDPFESKL